MDLATLRAKSFCMGRWGFLIGMFSALFVLTPRLLPGEDASKTFASQRLVPWNGSRVIGRPGDSPPYRVVRAYPAIELFKPLRIGPLPGTGDLLALQHFANYGGPGKILRFADRPESSEVEVFLEIPEIIYGVAFHPEFHENGYLFLGCNGPSEHLEKPATKVLRYRIEREPPYRCDPESRTLIIEWASNGHNGGDLTFGPDKMLYVSAGDGTSDSDANHAGQDLSNLNASILRIDVDTPSADRRYSIPAGNPFAALPDARPEIWAYGMRNPWRIFYDHAANQLWVGDNGQDLWEMVYLVERGANYGWSVMEGNSPFQLHRNRGPTPITPPTIEHSHAEARSLTGGLVYTGKLLPDLVGTYIYGDYSIGTIFGARHDGTQLTWQGELARSTLQISGFGTDTRGELLIVDHGGGFYRLEPNSVPADRPPFPEKLSETGLFASVAEHQMQPGIYGYQVNSPLWSDGAGKQRFLAVPGDQQIEFNGNRPWVFPEGTVLVKTFSYDVMRDGSPVPHRVETRLFTLQEGEWSGYSYAWNVEQTDAFLVAAEGKDELIQVLGEGPTSGVQDVRWRFPSRSECMVCHSRAAQFVLGATTAQMNRPAVDGQENQLMQLAHLGLLRPKPGEAAAENLNPTKLVRLPDPQDSDEPLQDRVRSYLHANCASCHVHTGGGNSKINLSYLTSISKAAMIGERPLHDTFGLANPRLIAPGHPESSVLLHRVAQRGRGQMPPLATNVVDERFIRLLQEWITGLNSSSEADSEPMKK